MVKYPIVGDESLMSAKKHGTSNVPVQENLRWGCDKETADRICNFNRHYAGTYRLMYSLAYVFFLLYMN